MHKFLFLLIGIFMFGMIAIAQAEEMVISNEATVDVVQAEKESDTSFTLTSLIAKLPSLKQSILFSVDKNEVKYAMGFTLASFWKEKIDIDVMYIPSEIVAIGASIELVNMGELIKFPILEDITFEPFVYVGTSRLGTGDDGLGENDYGIGAKIISINF